MYASQTDLAKTGSSLTSEPAAHQRGKAFSLPAVSVLQPQAESDQNAVVQRYEDEVLAEQQEVVKAATSSGAELLRANKNAQEILAASKDGNKQLSPYFTSMGFEVEFAQQPQYNKHHIPQNDLNKAHVIVSTTPGYDLFSHIPFVMETDAQLALEFVTPPLLAPLSDGKNIVPDATWEREARKALEFSLREISSSGSQSLGKIIGIINAQFDLSLPVPSKYSQILYGNIDKFGPNSYTNAQLNFMTTLDHYMAINRGTYGKEKDDEGYGTAGDTVTEEIYQLAMDYQDGEDNPYIYAVCQKIREIPSMLIDHIFSIVLHHDEHPDDEISTKKENKKLIATSKDSDIRRTLASEASHIKDTATLWLKASFNQIVSSVPAKSYSETIGLITELADKTDELIPILKKTSQFEALLPFYDDNDSKIIEFMEDQLQPLRSLTFSQQDIVSDINHKPAEQKTVSEERKNILGARPDTYIASDSTIADKNLFLVETRDTTSYLGLTPDDKF